MDDSRALNERIAAVGKAGGGIVDLDARDYSIGAPLDGSVANVVLRGVRRATRLVKDGDPADDGIISIRQPYRGWTFGGIEFVGGARRWAEAGAPHYFTACLSGTRGVRFRRCAFRDLVGAVLLRDASDIAFDDCDFWGTTPGVIAPGVIDPPAVAGATFTPGIAINEQVRDINIDRCRFHFCENAIGVNTQATQSASNLTVRDCSFRADWWDNPYPVMRFGPSQMNVASNGSITMTVASGGLRSFVPGQVVSFRRELATGRAFTRIYVGQVEADGRPFANAAVGDVIETRDGRRGRVGAIESPGSAWVDGWEDIATYEPTSQPTLDTPWRLSRRYACGIAAILSDTQIALYFEPVNPFTGERAVSDAKLDLGQLPAKVQAQTIYSGLHVNAGLDGFLATGNRFDGSWADQCSIMNCPGARVIGNSFRHGQDEAITLTWCPRSTVTGNEFVGCGVSAVFLGESHASTVKGNTVLDWGVTNPYGGAIHGGARDLVISGNSFSRSSRPVRDWCRWSIVLAGTDSTGTLISGNVDAGCTVATLDVDATAAPQPGAVCVRDVALITGAGRANVEVAQTGPPGPPGKDAQAPEIMRVEGQATIERGRTSVVVEHGLGGRPNPEDVLNPPVIWGVNRVWLAGVTDKTLTYRTDRAAPASGIAFTWSASRQP